MLLKSVKLEDFKKFDKRECEFSPGINVVKGQFNEIGKSTLLDGIIMALFENPKSTSKEIDRYRKWGAERKWKTVVEFETESRRYVLEKDFEMKTTRLAALDTNEDWRTPGDVANKIGELLGTNSPKLFLSTSCIRQDEVRDIESGKKEISESLEGIVTGGTDETVASQIIDKLSKQVDGLKKGLDRPAKSPGLIADLTRQMNEREQDLVVIRNEVNDMESQKLKRVETAQQLAQVEVDLGEKEAVLEKNKRRREIEGAIEKLEREYEQKDKLIGDIELLQKQIDGVELKLQAIKGFADRQKVLEVRGQLDELEFKRRSIGNDIPKRKDELKLAQEHLGKNKLLVGLTSRISLILGAAVAVAGFLGMVFNTAIAIAGVIGLLFLVAVMWARNSIAQRRTQVSGLQKRIEDMEGTLKMIDERERESLSQVECETGYEFERREKEHHQLEVGRDAFQNQLKGKQGEQTLEQIRNQRNKIIKDLAVERNRLTDDLESTRLSPEEYVKYGNDVNYIKKKREALERSKIECEVKIRNAKFDADVLAQKEEQLETLKDKLSRAQRKAQVYELARDFISKARTETLVLANDLLQTEIQKNFEIFTNGKYNKVMVKKGTLDFYVYSDEKGDLVHPKELSGGAIDEFYLACRLALVRLIYVDAKPPLILDDPFTNFDKPRLDRTLEFLRGMSKEHQIIIFTLGETYNGVADNLIELT